MTIRHGNAARARGVTTALPGARELGKIWRQRGEACELHRALAPQAGELPGLRARRTDAFRRIARLDGAAHLVQQSAFGVVATRDEVGEPDEVVARQFVGAL